MVMTHALRNAVEQAKIAVGLLRRQVRQHTFLDGGFDIGELPIPEGKLKAYATPRDMSALDMIVVHITAVNGGFGVSPKAVKRWEARIVDGAIPPGIAQQLANAGATSIQAMAKRLALWERYRETPYHVIAAANGDVVLNRRLEQRSWHANGANTGVGIAFDIGPKNKLEPWQIATGQHALGTLISEVYASSSRAWDRGIRIVPHRASSKSRRKDPGPEPWTKIVLPVVKRYDSVRVDYGYHVGTGLPVPFSWDPNATHDDKGRRL